MAYFTVHTNSSFGTFLIQSSIENRIPDITINVNGTLNKSANYTRSISCSTGASPYWNRKLDGLVFSNVADEDEVCGLTYTQDTSNHSSSLLSTIVQNTAVDETNATYPSYLTPNNKTPSLVNPVQYDYSSATATSSTSGIGSLSVWSLNNNNEYESNPSAMTYNGNRYYHLYAGIPENGSYKICYTIASGSDSTNNGLYIAVNGTNKTNILASTNGEVSGCYDFGSLSTSDYINISERKYNASATPPVITFRIEKGTPRTIDAGYRYEGTNPNNYIWFNNEIWRIIGLVPTCTSANCATSQDLVKIIRKEPLGTLTYDAKTSSTVTGIWGNNTLYSLLNNYYWGRQNASQKSGGGCSGYSTYNASTCDYRVIGLSSNTYYGSMVENVYWNTGASEVLAVAAQVYENELTNQIVQGYVGLLNASDYGFAANIAHTTNLFNYNTSQISLANWLCNNETMWLITADPDSSRAIFVDMLARIDQTSTGGTSNGINTGMNVLPVVYLSPSVYVVSGTGTEADPYIIAKGPTYLYYNTSVDNNVYTDNSVVKGYHTYIKELEGSNRYWVCGYNSAVSSDEICFEYNTWSQASNYYNTYTSQGIPCSQTSSRVTCPNNGSPDCYINNAGTVYCNYGDGRRTCQVVNGVPSCRNNM